jgi:hypothetical protein
MAGNREEIPTELQALSSSSLSMDLLLFGLSEASHVESNFQAKVNSPSLT